jgi:hypothetical protein
MGGLGTLSVGAGALERARGVGDGEEGRPIEAKGVDMMREVKRWGLAPALPLLLLGAAWLLAALPTAGCAEAAPAATAAPATPALVYEPEKSWKFDDDQLLFSNPSPNPDGSRFIRWKDYDWVVTKDLITVYDSRPYGTTLQGRRGQLNKDGKPLRDKDLMNELKDEAGNVRSNREPSYDPSVYWGWDYGYGWWGCGPHGFRHFHGGGHFHHH